MSAPTTPPTTPEPGRLSRREVLRYGAAGAAGAAVVGAAGVGDLAFDTPRAAAAATPGVLDLYVNDGYVPMVDESLVYMRGFGERPTAIGDPDPSLTIGPHAFLADGSLVPARSFPPGAASPPHGRPDPDSDDPDEPLVHLLRRSFWASFFPRRTIIAETGSRIRLRVHNGLAQPHRLAIPEVADTGQIAPGSAADLEFDAPAAGTYVYHDPGGDSVERVLGLCGVLVVVPRDDHWRLSDGGVEFERQWLWICHDVEPEWARRAAAGETVDPVATPAVPRYFTLNGRAGFQSLGVTMDPAVNDATHEETLVAGWPRRLDVRNFSHRGTASTVVTGQLIRLVNTGLVVHQLHFHGNHVWTVRRDGQDFSRSVGSIDADGHVVLQQWEDVVEIDPLGRKEVVLPLKPPPDVLPEVFAARTTDYHYPMHCHAEPSQTAAGGLYPGGLMADWELAGPPEGAQTAGGTP